MRRWQEAIIRLTNRERCQLGGWIELVRACTEVVRACTGLYGGCTEETLETLPDNCRRFFTAHHSTQSRRGIEEIGNSLE